MNEPTSDSNTVDQFSDPNYVSDFELKQAQSRSSRSVAFGVLSLFLSFVTGIFGLWLGISALRTISRHGGSSGKTTAIAGIVISLVFSIISGTVFLTVGWFYLGVSQNYSSGNKMRQLTLAMHNYETAYMEFPTDKYSRNGKPLLSWRVMLLPFLGKEYQSQFKKFNLEEPWDSPQNLEAAKELPEAFRRPGCRLEAGMTVYKRPVGNSALFELPRPGGVEPAAYIGSIIDGTGNTIMIVECVPEDAVFWSQPQTDYAFDPKNPRQGLGAGQLGTYIVAMADGSIRSVHAGNVIDAELKAAFTKDAQDGPSQPRRRGRRR